MHTPQTLTDLEVEDCRKLVQYKVRRFFGYRISTEDFEDACSHTMTHALAKLMNFEPDRGSFLNFVDQVAGSALRDEIRRKRAAKRTGTTCSLNCPVANGHEELWQTLADGSRADNQHEADLKIDLAEVSSCLDKADIELVEAKLAGNSASEMARKFGVCRGTIYRRLKAIKRKLKGFEFYA